MDMLSLQPHASQQLDHIQPPPPHQPDQIQPPQQPDKNAIQQLEGVSINGGVFLVHRAPNIEVH